MSHNPTDSLAPLDSGIPVRDEVKTPPGQDGMNRRQALQALSATALLAATAGCTRKPERKIISLNDAPEYQKPGQALYYASTWTEGDWPYGLMVKTADGRPIKIEGLPGHPLNDGTSSAQMQGALYSLYDPARLHTPEKAGEATTWEQADADVVSALKQASKVALVTRPTLGPSERALIAAFQTATKAQHIVWAPGADTSRRMAWKQVYGQDGVPMPDLEKASVILSVGADFLGTDGETLGQTRGFAANRKGAGGPKAERLSRLYVAEGAMTATGSSADVRIPLQPRLAAAFIEAVRKAVDGDASGIAAFAKSAGVGLETLANLAQDLQKAKGKAVVLAGGHLPESVHASVALLNDAIGAPGATLGWNAAPPALLATELGDATKALEGCDVVVFLGVNPVYDVPSVDTMLASAKLVVGHGLTKDETLTSANLALPSAHNLESWNDAAPLPGVKSLCQPMIAPLFEGRQEAESLFRWTKAIQPGAAALANAEDFHDFVRLRWQAAAGTGQDPQRAWEDALRSGFVGEATTSSFPALKKVAAQRIAAAAAAVEGGTYDIVALPHHAVGDGRFAGNAWLQELPCPVSKLVWDNAASLAPATAKELGVGEGDWLKVGDQLELPVLIQTGTAPHTIVTTLGHGRTLGAGPGNDVGFHVGMVGSGATPRMALGVKAEKLAREAYTLVRAQKTFSQHERPIVRDGTKDEYLEHPDFAKHRSHVPKLVQMHEEYDYSKGHKWAMAIDLNACTGCNACTIACQAENNISVVGKEEVGMGREMSWIRVDRYERGDEDNPIVSQQPMLCQHCDNAPCEMVCPVNATAHSPEGLNEQVYNRCVGTRYCANNCPYKVRRFNFYHYAKETLKGPVAELMQNPQVTVRSRGVMEKCTFCVQRINAAKFAAANAGETVADGAAQPACAQSCPANAIVFGDVNTAGSQIAAQRSSDLAYHVLEELNVRPNITYLARVRNPVPGTTRGEHDGGHG